MRFLVITSFYPPHHLGGYEMRCRDVIVELLKRGHGIQVITNRCTNRHCDLHVGESGVERCLHLRDEDTPVLTQIYRDIQDLRCIKNLIIKFRPEIIYLWHIQNLSNAILPFFSTQNIPIVFDEGGSGLEYLWRVHKRGIYFYRNDQDPAYKKFLKSFIYRTANMLSVNLIRTNWAWPQKMRVYFNSQSARQHAAEQGVPVSTATVIPSGIQLDRFPFRPRKAINTPVKIILPSRIKPLKGNVDGIGLLDELRRRSIAARLTLVGEVQSQAYLEEIKSVIDEHGLRESVSILPMVSQKELSEMYQEADICFFTSYFKTGFSRTPLEAMASGCLVISYGNEGSREVIQDHKTGYIVNEKDITTAADIIHDTIKRPQYFEEITRQARIYIEQNHSFDHYIDQIEMFLQESFK